MATEPTESTVADSQIPATEVEPEVTAPDAEASIEPEAPAEADDPDKTLKRMQRRIDKRTGDYYRARAENEQLRAQLESRGAGQTEAKESDPQAIAREIARIDRFTEKANDLVSRGTKAHPDYMESLKSLAAEVGDFVTPNGAPSKFMDVVLQVADEPGALLYHLGKNPDLAEELSDLSDLRLAAKLKLIERDMGEALKPQTVKTAKPLEAVKPINLAKKSPSNMTDAEYAKWRKAR
jgi:molecular chaperone GrpE (heat shock protein)